MKTMILASGLVAAFGMAMAAPAYAAPFNQSSTLTDQVPLSAAPVMEPRFTKVIDDLPLMPGLQLVEDEDVFFSSPQGGRIAETNAIGTVDIDDVYKFYRVSLPHLGWKAVDSRTFEREHEQLRIDAHANNKITIVRFTVKPMSHG